MFISIDTNLPLRSFANVVRIVVRFIDLTKFNKTKENDLLFTMQNIQNVHA